MPPPLNAFQWPTRTTCLTVLDTLTLMNHKARKTQSRQNTVRNKVNEVNKVMNKVISKVRTVRDYVPHRVLNKVVSIVSSSTLTPTCNPPPPTERERIRQSHRLQQD